MELSAAEGGTALEIETRDDLIRLVVEVLPRYADQITPHLRPALRFSAAAGLDRQPALQVGGGAHLPSDVAWPEHDGRMMHLVAVVDLRLVSEADSTGLLPRTGRLHFFYDAVAAKRGDHPGDADSWCVMLVPEPPEGEEWPVRVRPSYGGDEVFCTNEVLLEEHFGAPFVRWTVPSIDEEELEDVEWELNDRGGLALSVIKGVRSLAHQVSQRTPQMLGWPTAIRGPMRLECQLVSNGLHRGNGWGHSSDASSTLRHGLFDWVLLLQLNSWGERENGEQWGTNGMLYFWIRRDDLQSARFDRVWMILQSE